MAQVAKAGPVPAPAAASRIPAGTRNVATVERTPVEELSAKVGVAFNDSAFLFQGYEGRLSGDKQHRPTTPRPALFESATQTFAAVFEVDGAGASTVDAVRPRTSASLLSKAINTYETNAKVVSGALVARGSSVSFAL